MFYKRFLPLLLLILLSACQTDESDIVLPTLIFSSTPTLPEPSPTNTASATPLPSPTPAASDTPLPSATATATRQPSATFSPTPTPSHTPPATATLTPAPTLAFQLFGGLAGQIDPDGVIQTIADMQNFDTRHTLSAQNNGYKGIDAALAYLVGRMTAQAATCAAPAYFYEDRFTVVYQGVTTTQTNTVLEVRGSAPDAGVVVIGAHYDTISKTPRFNPFGFQPGADDNGSGVAATLELARLFCLQPRQKTVVFVLFAAEEIRTETEVGRVGSRHFVTRFVPTQSWRIDAMFNLDTIGSATDTRGFIVDNLARIYSAGPIDSPSRQLARRLQAAAYIQMPDFELIVEDAEDRENRWGDHMSFTRAGYPAARLFEGSEDVDRQDSPQDLLNDIDPPYLVKNIQVVLAFLLGESEGFPPPQNVVPNGRIVFWEAVPEAVGYLVALRQPGENNYTFTILPPEKTGIELPANTIFAIGTIGANGVVGALTAENFVSS